MDPKSIDTCDNTFLKNVNPILSVFTPQTVVGTFFSL